MMKNKDLELGDHIGMFSYGHRRILGIIDNVDENRAYVGDIAFKRRYINSLHRIGNRVNSAHSMHIYYNVVNPVEHPAYFNQ